MLINVHLSKDQIGTYVACGNIPAAAPVAAPTTGGNPFGLVSIALALGFLALGTGLTFRRFAR